MVVAVVTKLRCVLCGLDRRPAQLGLAEDGSYDAATALPNEMTLRIDTIGGRGRLSVDRQPVPLPTAYGLRSALQAALARVEADIVAAGGEL